MRSVLLDSGPQIALFATDDRHYARFDGLVKDLSEAGLRLMTTWPCVVEAAFLLQQFQRITTHDLTEFAVCSLQRCQLTASVLSR